MKKKTRAYKIGHSDGVKGKYSCPYNENSTRRTAYNKGFRAANEGLCHV